MKFDCIVADPAWPFNDRLLKMKSQTKRSAQSQYNTMSISDIAALDVHSLANPEHCVLVMWVPSTLLPEGLMVMNSWKFSFKQTFIWVKSKKDVEKKIKSSVSNGTCIDLNDMLSFGMGRLFRQSHELALIGTLGKVYSNLENKSQRSVLFDFNHGHSIKPEGLQDKLELMFPNANYLELFSRRVRPNWTCLGNAIDGKDIGQAIQDTILL